MILAYDVYQVYICLIVQLLHSTQSTAEADLKGICIYSAINESIRENESLSTRWRYRSVRRSRAPLVILREPCAKNLTKIQPIFFF